MKLDQSFHTLDSDWEKYIPEYGDYWWENKDHRKYCIKRYLPLNGPDIRPHYPICKVIFHFVLTSLKTRTKPVKLQINRMLIGWWVKCCWKIRVTTTRDKHCEKFSTEPFFVHRFKMFALIFWAHWKPKIGYKWFSQWMKTSNWIKDVDTNA